MDTIILQWPGYESVDFSVPIDVRAITVCQLAGKVASSYQDFFKVDLNLYHSHICFADCPFRPGGFSAALHVARVGPHSYTLRHSQDSRDPQHIRQPLPGRGCRRLIGYPRTSELVSKFRKTDIFTSANRPTSGATVRVGTVC